MTKALLSLALGAAAIGAFTIVACVGDDPVATNSPVVDSGAPAMTGTPSGSATSTPPPATGGDDDASTGTSGGLTDSGSNGTTCHFTTTFFQCVDPEPPVVCYSDSTYCTVTGCTQKATDVRWECDSPRQCAGNAACCVSNDVATLGTGSGCNQRGFIVKAGTTQGATCAQAQNCDPGNTQLCQANSDCPTNQHCVPITLGGPPGAMNDVTLGACVPN